MSDDLDALPLDPITRKVWEQRVDAAPTAAESNHYYLALRQDDRLREVVAELALWRAGELGCQRRPQAGETIDGPCPDCGRARGLHRR